ncbi:MAG: dihydrodipicolinate reductase C-terminal domain-containing protein [Bdellovibrionota bacterium]|nr:MAG: dihydrodipicolinate reductase C-terminal domain-containing protein [Bdellovibrionota bacterium]
MKAVPILLSGLPGQMCQEVLRAAQDQEDIEIYPRALGSERHAGPYASSEGNFEVVPPAHHRSCLIDAQKSHPGIVVVEFSTPQSVERNVELFCTVGMPFVCGTTGSNSEKLSTFVAESSTTAVIAVNMAAEIVLLQAMWEWAANEFPGLLSEAHLKVTESHQSKKRDVSGTAIRLGQSFAKLGMAFDINAVESIRDPERQRRLGVPDEFLGGHGWHRYQIDVPKSHTHIELIHNVCGRSAYARGALLAAHFLRRKMQEGASGRCFSMLDVMRGTGSA